MNCTTNSDVLLIALPPWVPFQPYPSLPYLAGALRAKGIECTCLDASIEFYEYILRSDVLRDSHEKAISQPNRTRAVVTAEAIGKDVVNKSYLVQEILRGSDFFEPTKRSTAISILARCLDLVAAAHPDCRLTLYSAQGPWNHKSTASLAKSISNIPSNPFQGFFEQEIVPKIAKSRPGVVGLSVVFPEQVFPCLLLSRMIKAALPGVLLVAGGAFFSAVRDAITDPEHLFYRLIDYIVVGEGETELVRLVNCMEKGRIDNRVPLILAQPENAADIATPAYDLLPLEKYFSPEPVLSLHTSRGCYWNKCTFCNRDYLGLGRKHESIDASSVVAQMQKLHSLTNARCYAFWDDAVPPATLVDIARLLSRQKEEFFWYAQVRPEPFFDRSVCNLLHGSGCRQVYVGLETGSARLLSLLDKGLHLPETIQVCQNFVDEGIVCAVGIFFGYPGEILKDRIATASLLEDNARLLNVSSRDVGVFALQRGSHVFFNAAQYGVSIAEPEENDLAINFNYVSDQGHTLEGRRFAEYLASHLENQGHTDSHFGPHYLLYQMVQNNSFPQIEPPAILQNNQEVTLSKGLVYGIFSDNGLSDDSSSRAIVYAPSTSSIVLLGPEWLRWVSGPDKNVSLSNSDFQEFIAEVSADIVERLLTLGFLEIT